jgi:4-diphosphocytidyl-2-C-methyl-D-erythritol kinase
MILFPNAKINLGLNIVEKRQDNYHNIETIFYPVPWFDILEINPSQTFDFQSSGIAIDGNSTNNLCCKVYDRYKELYQIPTLQIHLHKSIPVGAGLGGGSSDAAFTAKLIQEMFHLPLTSEQLEELVKPLGSDCAFFIQNKPIYAEGKGDQFREVSISLAGKHIVLIYPNLHISTKEAYEGVIPQTPTLSVKEIITRNIPEWKDLLINDFEKSLFAKYPQLQKIKEELYANGALYASMSGSGSTIFGIFESEVNLKGAFPAEYLIQTGVLK